MAVFDTNVIPLYDQAYGSDNWKALEKDAEVPDYVKAALARGDYNSSLGLSPELLKSAKLGTFDMNGQTNYGFEIPQELRRPFHDDTGNVIGYTDPAGNIIGGEGFSRYGIQVPLAQNQPAEALSGDIRPAFRGQTISGYGDSGAAFDFNGDAATPTRGMLDFASKVEKDRAAASKVSPITYLGPLAMAALTLGLGPLGGAAALGSLLGGAGSAAAGGAGVGLAAELGATGAGLLGAGEAGLGAVGAGGIGLGGAVPEGGALSIFGADAAPGILSAGGIPGEGALTGAGAVASGATPVTAAPTGFLSSAYSSMLDTAIDALTAAGLTPAEAAAAAPIVTKSLIGGGVGALTSGVSGGDPLKGGLTGALGGGLVGAFGGAEGALANMLGVSGGAADAIIGAGVGGLGSYAQGQDPLTGALAGGIAGYGSNALFNGSPLTGAAALGASEATKGAGATGGGLFGTGKGISGSALALGALAGGTALLGNKNNNTPAATTTSGTTPGPEQVAGTLGPYFNKNLNYDVSGRTVLDPYFGKTPSYWSYGGTPEKQFFGNNSLKAFGFADGGYVDDDEVYPTYDGRPFSTEEGDSHVRGPGTGTSDSIDARLSDGEYVLTAREISDAGLGDNAKGAMKLDRLRKSGALTRFLASA